MRRRGTAGPSERAQMVAHLRHLHRLYAELGSLYGAQADRLESGVAVEVWGWELPLAGVEPNRRYRLREDDSVVPVERSRDCRDVRVWPGCQVDHDHYVETGPPVA